MFEYYYINTKTNNIPWFHKISIPYHTCKICLREWLNEWWCHLRAKTQIWNSFRNRLWNMTKFYFDSLTRPKLTNSSLIFDLYNEVAARSLWGHIWDLYGLYLGMWILHGLHVGTLAKETSLFCTDALYVEIHI